ncbi:MAG TPA: PadR family transcriptional regulator [Acidimicrobiales bacterium]
MHHHHEGHSHRAPWQQNVGSNARDEGRSAFGAFPGAFESAWRGPLGPRGFGRGRGPGGRARRGDVRAAILALLAERPMHGYEIIQELAERTNGLWKVSPGSVYPALQLLEDEGHIVAEEDAGKRRFGLTESGRALSAEAAGGKFPWEEVVEGVNPGALKLRGALGQLAAAVIQVGHVATSDQQTEAIALLDETRRKLYTILSQQG